jgi:hypothetical protein
LSILAVCLSLLEKLRRSRLAWRHNFHYKLRRADAVLAGLGFQVPQVVVYRIDAVTAWLARAVFKFNVPHISLVNLILEEAVRDIATRLKDFFPIELALFS